MEVSKRIRELPHRTSPGPDGIWAPDLFIDLEGTARYVAKIYKSSLDSG